MAAAQPGASAAQVRRLKASRAARLFPVKSPQSRLVAAGRSDTIRPLVPPGRRPGNDQATTRGCQFFRRGEKLGAKPGGHPRPHRGHCGPGGGGDRARGRLLQRQQRPQVHPDLPERRPAGARQPGADRRLAGRARSKASSSATTTWPKSTSKSNRSCTRARRRRSAPPRSPVSPTTTSRSAPARTAARRSTTAPNSGSARPRPRSTSTSSSIPSRPRCGAAWRTSSRATPPTFDGHGEAGNEAFKYFGPALNRTDAFAKELNADQRLLENFIVSTAKLSTTIAQRGDQLSGAISNANTAFNAIADQNVAFDQTLRRLPPVMRQANTTFVNLRAALDDLDPLVETAKPATKDLAPFLAELRPVISKFIPFTRNLRLTVARPGQANDTAELLAVTADGPGTGVERVPALRSRDRRLPAEPQLRPRLHAGPLQRLRQARSGRRLLRRQRALCCAPRPRCRTSSNTKAGR